MKRNQIHPIHSSRTARPESKDRKPGREKRVLICSTGLVNYLMDAIHHDVHQFSLNHPRWEFGSCNPSRPDVQTFQKVLAELESARHPDAVPARAGS